LILLWGFAGAFVFLLALLPVTLRIRCRVRLPGYSEAEIRALGLPIALWRARPAILETPPATQNIGTSAGRKAEWPGELLEAERALEACVRHLRGTGVQGFRLCLSGSAGDAARTAMLYGTAWAEVGEYLTTTGIRPELVRLEPIMEGPAQASLDGSCAVDVRVFTLLRCAYAALLALRRS